MNHSLRATAATRLYQAGVDEQLVMEKTGHRSIEGVRSYKHTSEQQLQQLSDILHGSSSTVNYPSHSSTASLIQPVQQPLAVQANQRDNSTEISVHHNSASKNMTMNFTQTPSFIIQGCMVTINNITHAVAPWLSWTKHRHQSLLCKFIFSIPTMCVFIIIINHIPKWSWLIDLCDLWCHLIQIYMHLDSACKKHVHGLQP